MRHKIKRQFNRINGHKLAAVFIIGLGLFVAAFVVRSQQTTAADLRLCRYQQQDRNVLRSILVLARTASERSRAATPQQRRDAEMFYRAALRLAPRINCGALPSRLPHLIP